MLIYALKNTVVARPDGLPKMYIGKTEYDDPKVRWEGHLYDVEKGSRYYIHNAIRFYGEAAFEVSILEEGVIDSKVLCEREIFWIAEFNTFNEDFGYNMTLGGDNPPNLTGRPKSITWKEQTRQRMLGNKYGVGRPDIDWTAERRAFSSAIRYAILADMTESMKQELTAPGRKRISELRGQGIKVGGAQSGELHHNFGQHLSERTREKISEKATANYRSNPNPLFTTLGRTPTDEENKQRAESNSSSAQEYWDKQPTSEKQARMAKARAVKPIWTVERRAAQADRVRKRNLARSSAKLGLKLLPPK